MKHTPEPWIYTAFDVPILFTGVIKHNEGREIAAIYGNMGAGEANAARIVACVNACAGMDDPAAEIERLRDMEKNIAPILQTVRALAQQISGDKSIDQMTRLEALGLLMAIPAEKGANT